MHISEELGAFYHNYNFHWFTLCDQNTWPQVKWIYMTSLLYWKRTSLKSLYLMYKHNMSHLIIIDFLSINILMAETFDLVHSEQFPHLTSALLQVGWGTQLSINIVHWRERDNSWRWCKYWNGITVLQRWKQKDLKPPAYMCAQIVSGKVRKRLIKDGRCKDLRRSGAHTLSCCGSQCWLSWAKFSSRSSEDNKGSISLFQPITQHKMPMRTKRNEAIKCLTRESKV